MYPAVTGSSYSLRGKIVVDLRYGPQIELLECTLIDLQINSELIEQYLRKHLSARKTKELLRRFGKDTIDRIATKNVDLSDYLKNSQPMQVGSDANTAKSEQIATGWTQFLHEFKLSAQLSDLNIGVPYHTRIIAEWGDRCIPMIKANPYILMEVSGFGFKRADTVALNLGMAFDDIRRLAASTIQAAQDQIQGGHIWSDVRQIEEQSLTLSGKAVFLRDVEEKVRDNPEIPFSLQITSEDEVAIPFYAKAERDSVACIRRIQAPSSKDKSIYYKPMKKVALSDLNEKQRLAFEMATSNTFSIITGGPGTGKTHIIKKILDCYEGTNIAINTVLLAPTGKAAVRMTELTNHHARTIHSALLPNVTSLINFYFNEHHQLNKGVYIIDEVSMIDISVFAALLRAIPTGSHVILVGDANQLPSIGPGNVLADLIDSQTIPVTELETVMRNAANSTLIKNARKALSGDGDFSQHLDFVWVRDQMDDIQAVAKKIQELKQKHPSAQIIVPMNKGAIGTMELNSVLQGILNPKGTPIRGTRFRYGDRIMITRNDAEYSVSNGELGTILSANPEGDGICIRLDARDDELILPGKMTDILNLSYAITIHKAQGSEFEQVILALHKTQYIMLTKNLVYTALTRAKKTVYLLGTKNIVSSAVKRKLPHRRTKLVELLNKLPELKLEEQKTPQAPLDTISLPDFSGPPPSQEQLSE